MTRLKDLIIRADEILEILRRNCTQEDFRLILELAEISEELGEYD